MNLSRLIVSMLVVAMASCAVAKEAILFLNAHPDDTDGFAGTAYLLKDKYEIHVVDLTRGELGLGPAGLADGSTAYRRTQEETKAQAYYGAKLHFLSEVDGSAAAGTVPAHVILSLGRSLSAGRGVPRRLERRRGLSPLVKRMGKENDEKQVDGRVGSGRRLRVGAGLHHVRGGSSGRVHQ